MTAPTIGFVGLTHLGLVSSAAAADKGFPVVAYDPDAGRVEAMRGPLPVLEPGLEEMVGRNRGRLAFTTSAAALAGCDLVYVATDVPTDDAGASDLSGIEALVAGVLPHLAERAVLVVLCQVPPGFTRRISLDPARLFYQVETLVFGQAVERAAAPERFILGCARPEAALPAALATYLGAFGCPVLPMRFESAELCKIAINCFLAASIGTTNALAELSERLGADWQEIAPALRLDRRIGPHAYLGPGLGIAGGNIERDLATVVRLGAELGTDAGPIAASIANSRHRRNWVWHVLEREVLPANPDPLIGLLGLAYKENTNSIKNSPALALIGRLTGRRLRAYDPAVAAASLAHPGLHAAADALDAARGVHVLAVMTPWPAFRSIAPGALAEVMAGRMIIDPYRVLDGRAAQAAGFRYHGLGMPPLG